MYAHGDETFKVMSQEESEQLDIFMHETEITAKSVAYTWGAVKYSKTVYSNVVTQERLFPYKEDHPKFGTPGAVRTLIKFEPVAK